MNYPSSIQMFYVWLNDKILLIAASFITGIVFDRILRSWSLPFYRKRSSTCKDHPYDWNIELSLGDVALQSDDSTTMMDHDREIISSNSSSLTATETCTVQHHPLHVQDHLTTPCNNLSSSDDKEDKIRDEWAILQGAIQLCYKRWENHHHGESYPRDPNNHQESTKVVNFLTPKEVISSLFTHSHSDINTKDPSNDSLDRTLSLRRRRKQSSTQIHEHKHLQVQSMLHMFQQIQHYSVNTSHPYFFNQMFGTLDPIALAAELIALSVHTSVYTFETAPIFTMIEREVISTLCTLIFEKKDEYMEEMEDEMDSIKPLLEDSDQRYDGLMLPGGSISNLTAIHLARYMSTKKCPQHNPFNLLDASQEADSDKKKDELHHMDSRMSQLIQQTQEYPTNLVAFVSQEAHYSFGKAVSITGLGLSNLITVPTLPNGPMNVDALDKSMLKVRQEGKIPFFVAVTAGSTVRGSFDDIEAILHTCRKHERLMQEDGVGPMKIWIHVDGAWGGAAIFSKRPEINNLVRGVDQVDSFTFNPHKMLGASQQTTAFVTRHKGIMKESNALGAKYLFDNRRVGASLDLGDNSFTCGRRSDAVKLWAMWKYYGSDGLGTMVESRVDFLSKFALAIQDHEAFILACEPWPFNINFFYIPKRFRSVLERNCVDTKSRNPTIPDDISADLGKVSVELKLRLQQSGEMLIPYQPLSSQQGECFRLVIAGNKSFEDEEIVKIMNLMDQYGFDL